MFKFSRVKTFLLRPQIWGAYKFFIKTDNGELDEEDKGGGSGCAIRGDARARRH
jgi:hypothetical protein